MAREEEGPERRKNNKKVASTLLSFYTHHESQIPCFHNFKVSSCQSTCTFSSMLIDRC